MVDDRGRPVVVRCVGWKRGPEGGPDLILMLGSDMTRAPPGQGASDRVTVLMNESERFVAYQLKGLGRTRSATAEEVRSARSQLDALGYITEKGWGLPASLYTSIPVEPTVVVEVMVEAAFAQSPGAGAGARIGGTP